MKTISGRCVGYLIISAVLCCSVRLVAEAQQANKIARIGFIATDGGQNFDLFRHSLRELGYVEGTNMVIESRFFEERLDQVPGLDRQRSQAMKFLSKTH